MYFNFKDSKSRLGDIMKYYCFYYYLILLSSTLIKLSHPYLSKTKSVRDIELLLPVVYFTLYKIFICNVFVPSCRSGNFAITALAAAVQLLCTSFLWYLYSCAVFLAQNVTNLAFSLALKKKNQELYSSFSSSSS